MIEGIKYKESDNWESPGWILDLFEGFYDPCPLMDGGFEMNFINGLESNWKKKNYVNPPYSNPKPWVIKAIEENKKGKLVVMLLPVDTTTEWYLMLKNAGAHIILPNERLKFNGSKTPARWGCMIAILDKEKK